MPDLLNAAQAAESIGIKPQTLATWRLKGFGPRHIKCGSRCMYSREEILAWLESRTRKSTSDPGTSGRTAEAQM